MKTFGLNFGVQAIQSGQKNATVNAEPQLIANSTLGKFIITSPVSKALNIAVGENVMFLNNIAALEAAVQAKNEDVLAIASEYGIDLNTKDGEDTFIAKFTQWFIAKGVPQFKRTGEPIMTTERYSKEDKTKYLEEHGMEIVEANYDALVETFGELPKEEMVTKLTVDMVESPKVPSVSGSKTATTSSTTGVGCQLNFTDTAIWNSLKKDLGEDITKKNRIYDVVLKATSPEDSAPMTVPFNNGYKDVEITIYPIVYKEDVNIISRNKKD